MTDAPKTKLVLNFPLSTSDKETLARIEKVAKPAERVENPVNRAVLYLRAASGRCSIALSAFYVFLAAEASTPDERKAWKYADQVKHYTLRFSTITTIALCVRAIYDASANDLCAKTVTGASSSTFSKLAQYWAKKTSRDFNEAELALCFVQDVLARCSIPISAAKKSDCILARRVALMKAYADRESAHISLHSYEYTLLDVAHVVAATALLGAVIHHFDVAGESGPKFLARLDEGAHASAVELFPKTKKVGRLFDDKRDLDLMIRNLYKGKIISGADYLSTYLPSALGLDGMPREFFEIMAASGNRGKG